MCYLETQRTCAISSLINKRIKVDWRRLLALKGRRRCYLMINTIEQYQRKRERERERETWQRCRTPRRQPLSMGPPFPFHFPFSSYFSIHFPTFLLLLFFSFFSLKFLYFNIYCFLFGYLIHSIRRWGCRPHPL